MVSSPLVSRFLSKRENIMRIISFLIILFFSIDYHSDLRSLYNSTLYSYASNYSSIHYTPFSFFSSKNLLLFRSLIIRFLVLHRSFLLYRCRKLPPIYSRARTRIFDLTPRTHSTPFYKVRNLHSANVVKRCFHCRNPPAV